MPRGKNYVNNNQGVSMQSSKKKKAPSMEQCFYGKGCTRANCFYRHDGPATNGASGDKSTEPCMPFLAGLCTFSAGGCRKRHPGKAEAEKLVAKYKQTKCRYGDHCKTAGCLYIHPGDENGGKEIGATSAFPPLSGSVAVPRPMAPAGAWKPMQPTGGATTMASVAASAPAPPMKMAPSVTATATPPVKSAWQPSPPPAAAPAWGGRGPNPILTNHANNGNTSSNNAPAPTTTPKPVVKNGTTVLTPVVASRTPQPSSTVARTTNNLKNLSLNNANPSPATQTQTQTLDSPSLNINAKEFVPGGF